MKYVYDAPVATPKKAVAKHESRVDATQSPRRKQKRRNSDARKRAYDHESESDSDSDADKVYVVRPETKKTDGAGSSAKSKSAKDKTRRPSIKVAPKPRSVAERRAPQRRHTVAATLENESPCPPQQKSLSSTDLQAKGLEVDARPALKRSATTAAARTEVSLAKSTATTREHKKAPSVFSSFFQSKPPSPEKKVSCLTCGDDDVLLSKSARLPCKHRMCHSCLKRVFKMSITDPAHMPPRCCTDDHIDLKHVDKLFNQDFKKNWNRKFLEYKTKNRVYCIGKNCGEWIKPSHITVEHGRNIGKCKKCGTKVCAICNNKAHLSRDCPKDPATKQFIDTAKQKGWQKCFNCSAMVELKEGCNHMTCRCTAEFCMVCGLKWKSCDCPWFNYEAADAHLGNPQRYQEELDRRRDQEQRDEALAQRMEVLGIDAEQAEGGFFGLGNGAGHHMNANFIQQAREALTANYQNAEQAARGLINGWYMGRENRMPDVPEHMNLDELPRILRQQSQRRTAPLPDAAEADGAAPRRSRPVNRRRTAQAQGIGNGVGTIGRHQATPEEQDQRIREWATGVHG
jgi:hypothetical protein